MRKVKRHLAVLLSFAMILSLFPIPVKAADTLSQVSLKINHCVDGMSVSDYEDYVTILNNDEVAFDTAYSEQSVWAMEKESGEIATTFEYGKEYTLYMYFTTANDYIVLPEPDGISNPEIQVSINNGNYTGVVYKELMEVPVVYLSVTYDFMALREIESLELELIGYQCGNKVLQVSANSSNGDVELIGYELADSEGAALSENSILKTDTEYYFRFYFMLNQGCTDSKLKKENITIGNQKAIEYLAMGDGFCGAYIPLETLQHTGETEVRNVKTPTCKEEGFTGDVYCLSCNQMTVSGSDIPKTEEHSYDTGVVTKEPTETDEGIKTYTCTICEVTKTEVLPAIGKAEAKPQPPADTDKKEEPNAPKDTDKKEESNAPAKNTTLTDVKTGMKYKVTKAGTVGGTVEFKAPKNKKVKKVTIPSTVKIDGITYKVTSIGKNAFKGCSKLTSVTIGKNVTKIGAKAFYGCKKLKKITIKTTKLKTSTVGKNAFKGTPKSAVVKVPKKSLKAYKKFLYKKGVHKKATIKK